VPIQGTIEDAGLADVIQVLCLARRSGRLTVIDGSAHGEIFIESGVVTYATVTNRRDRVLDLLASGGNLTPAQLAEAIVEQDADGERPLGRILLESGRFDRAEVEAVVCRQVEEAVCLVFAWTRGSFTFTTGVRPPADAVLVRLDPTNLLLECARRIDEWSLIRRKIPSHDQVYHRTAKYPGAADASLTPEQQRLWTLLDGTRDVSRLIAESGLGEFQASRALYGLVMAEFAQPVERRSHIRHLDYRELLAYAVREAEFADAARRADAARHVAHCRDCEDRLRAIHVRRTSASPASPEALLAGDLDVA